MDYETYFASLETFPDQILARTEKRVGEALDTLLATLPPYPSQEHNHTWTSPAQKAEYWRRVAAGEIDNPYQRTFSMLPNFRRETSINNGTITGRLYNPYPEYALVIGDTNEQLTINQDRWWHYDEEIAKNAPKVLDKLDEQVWKITERIWSNV